MTTGAVDWVLLVGVLLGSALPLEEGEAEGVLCWPSLLGVGCETGPSAACSAWAATVKPNRDTLLITATAAALRA
ncbi:hypothetical protein UM93_16100 [Psychromicrobium lacuslunae]|uniref:Uncharacterized protein n=1 Tax=Psychromicrobium lacuslunae TaxID=1618207 RepID=A0A0D4C208_9MICC|nr:hypothetical protein UM93_16100 [Psychromicrobium lacuslunae]